MASQTETAWRAIFEERQLLSDLERHGYGTVTADEIKRIGQREPRLMTKFDTRESRPDTIKKAACTVLPISNGTYVLVRGDGYLDLPERPTPERIPTKALDHLQTLQLFCESEAQVLEVAHTCGLLERFLREKVERTTQGRNRASFSFRFIGDAEHRFLREVFVRAAKEVAGERHEDARTRLDLSDPTSGQSRKRPRRMPYQLQRTKR